MRAAAGSGNRTSATAPPLARAGIKPTLLPAIKPAVLPKIVPQVLPRVGLKLGVKPVYGKLGRRMMM